MSPAQYCRGLGLGLGFRFYGAWIGCLKLCEFLKKRDDQGILGSIAV